MVAVTTALWSFALVAGSLLSSPVSIPRSSCVLRQWGAVRGMGSGLGYPDRHTALGRTHFSGVTALLTASHLAYEILRWAGAGYLVWLGVRMFTATSRISRWRK